MLRLFWSVFLILTIAIASAQNPNRLKPRPIRFDGQTLFNVYTEVDTLQPAERVTVIQDRLDVIANSTQPLDFEVRPTEHGTSVMFEGSPVVTVTRGDADILSRTTQDLAVDYERKIQAAITRYRHDRVWNNSWATVVFAIAILLATALLVYATAKLTTRWELAVIGTLDRSARKAHSFHRAINSLRTLVVLATIFTGVTTALSIVPWTRDTTSDLTDLFARRLHDIRAGFAQQAENISFLITIVAITWLLLIIIRALFDAVAAGQVRLGAIDSELASPTYRIVRVFVIVIAVVAAYPYIPGSSTPAFQGISVFLGALFSLGSTNVVGNIVAGLLSTYTRPFKPGDYVQIGETSGFIIGKTDLVTRIRSITNIEISIPNSMLLSVPVVNYSSAARGDGLILTVMCTIGYKEDWRMVTKCLVDAAERTADIMDHPSPYVLQNALNDFDVSFELCAHTRNVAKKNRVISDLLANIQDECDRAGVEMTTPNYVVVTETGKVESAKPAPSLES